METEFTQEELKWCLSTMRAQLVEMEKLDPTEFSGIKMRIFKMILSNSGTFTDEDLAVIQTKEDVIHMTRALIEELEKYLEFDPEDDVAVKYLREIGAGENLIGITKSRITPDNIKYS